MTNVTKADSESIKVLRLAGISQKKIGEQLGHSREVIRYQCKKETLLASIGPKPIIYKGSIQGRNPLKIKSFIMANPKATLEEIKIACDLDISLSQLSVYLKRFGMASRRARSRIIISNINKQKRLIFCRWMLEQSDEFIDSICFSDETVVKSQPNGEVVLFRAPEGTDWYSPSNAGGGKFVMFWGCASKAAYGPLVVIEGKNTAEKYITTLSDHLLPEIQASPGLLTFQQDNASIHKTRAVMSFLTENGVKTFEWPPQSPDLSPIENIWNAVKMKMKALRPRPRSHALMRDAVLQIWENLDNHIRTSLIESFRSRLHKCIAARGEIVK